MIKINLRSKENINRKRGQVTENRVLTTTKRQQAEGLRYEASRKQREEEDVDKKA